ncbi:hypothetical protein SAMN04515695_0357 [Pseudovibrio sp. Tun.PSC04-5.I4]|nr:hypothetical protein SAMN04515695_0357 [Pseudovibrio sp. Tun.PSC04-5.I4]
MNPLKSLNNIVWAGKNHFAQCCAETIQNGRVGVHKAVKNVQRVKSSNTAYVQIVSPEAVTAPDHFADNVEVFQICTL